MLPALVVSCVQELGMFMQHLEADARTSFGIGMPLDEDEAFPAAINQVIVTQTVCSCRLKSTDYGESQKIGVKHASSHAALR